MNSTFHCKITPFDQKDCLLHDSAAQSRTDETCFRSSVANPAAV